jgi:hypothetical protein
VRGANESFRKFLADDVPRGGLMRGVEEAVQKADGDRPDAGIPKGSDRLAHSGLVERGFDMPVVGRSAGASGCGKLMALYGIAAPEGEDVARLQAGGLGAAG